MGEEEETVQPVGPVWRACHCINPKDQFTAAYPLRQSKTRRGLLNLRTVDKWTCISRDQNIWTQSLHISEITPIPASLAISNLQILHPELICCLSRWSRKIHAMTDCTGL